MTPLPHIYRCRDNRAIFYTWFSAMHTRVDITLAGNRPEREMLVAAADMRDRILRTERIGNCFDSCSELSLVNREAATHPVAVSAELENILTDCLRYSRQTDGLFDIAAGSLSSDHIIIPGDGTIAFSRRGLYLNLSGFLKGYALEQLRAILDTHCFSDALISLGNSSVMARGDVNPGQGWTVAFSSRNPSHGPVNGITLHNRCLTTSGNDRPERRHIIDPRTGRFIEGARSVSIVNDNAAEGEVLATAHFIDPATKFPSFAPYRIITAESLSAGQERFQRTDR